MPERRNVLTPEALAMIDVIARSGSFAAAARELGKVPSSLTYSVRQLEDALDVLLFDRSSRQARLTAAGDELLGEGRRLLQEMDAVVSRVRRVASGWESQLSIAVDDVVSQTTMFELITDFTGVCAPGVSERSQPGTRLRLRTEVMAGTWEALFSGQVDLAIGLAGDFANPGGIEVRPLGDIGFVFVVAPHHALAGAAEPLDDAELVHHRAVAVADSAHLLAPLTRNLLPGQDVLTVPSMRAKLEALLRGLGCGFVPEPLARAHIDAGHLVPRRTGRDNGAVTLHYAWRNERGAAALGHALRWWLDRLDSPATRRALIERQAGPMI